MNDPEEHWGTGKHPERSELPQHPELPKPPRSTSPPVSVNRAVAWFRVILWLVPSVFAWVSAKLIDWIGHRLHLNTDWYSGWGFPSWVAMNVAFIIGIGWCHGMLLERKKDEPIAWIGRIGLFFFLQLILIPLLSALFLLAMCALNPSKLGGH